MRHTDYNKFVSCLQDLGYTYEHTSHDIFQDESRELRFFEKSCDSCFFEECHAYILVIEVQSKNQRTIVVDFWEARGTNRSYRMAKYIRSHPEEFRKVASGTRSSVPDETPIQWEIFEPVSGGSEYHYCLEYDEFNGERAIRQLGCYTQMRPEDDS